MLNSLPAIILARLFASAGVALWQVAACVAPAAGRQMTMGHRTTKSKKRDKIMPGQPVGRPKKHRENLAKTKIKNNALLPNGWVFLAFVMRGSGSIRKKEVTCEPEALGSSAFKKLE